jgi:hypothetical protein
LKNPVVTRDDGVAGRGGLGGRGDSAVAVAIGVVVFWAYFLLGLRLAHGDYFQANNFAFDYDAATYVRSFFGDGGAFILRHPFVAALRPFCKAALALGIPLPAAISGFFAAIGALTVSVAYLCFANLGLGLPERLLLAAFFALSSCQAINGIVADSFGLSGLGLAILYFLFLKRANDPARAPVARYGVAVYLFGITVSNLVQPVIAEVVLWFGRVSPLAFVRRLFVSGLILGGLLLAGMLLFVPWGTLPPLQLVRHYYWESQFHGAEMVGLWTVLKSFVAYTFVAPEFTMVPLPNGEPGMLDFRDFRMSGTGLWALGLWLALLASGIACAVSDRQQRRLAAFLGLVVGINLVIHHYVQFRLSVYLYGSHVQLAILLVAALALRMSSRRGGPVRVVGLTGMAGLALLTGLNNIPRFLELVSAFG